MFFKGCENTKAALHAPGVVVVDIALNHLDKALRPLPYKIGIHAARKYMFRGTGA